MNGKNTAEQANVLLTYQHIRTNNTKIGKDGAIENLRVVSGHPMLLQSAMEAVRQWRYKPYFLNGQPVEVDTQVTVRFSLETN